MAKKKTPYTTNDQTNPINVYGESKLAGEIEIQKILKSNFSIIRTSWLYSSFGNNFVKTMINLMNEKSEIKVVSDQIGCPTYARGLAQFIFLILSKEHEKLYTIGQTKVLHHGLILPKKYLLNLRVLALFQMM